MTRKSSLRITYDGKQAISHQATRRAWEGTTSQGFHRSASPSWETVPMSVTHEADPGCSALGHLYRPDGDRKICITCGDIQEDSTSSNS